MVSGIVLDMKKCIQCHFSITCIYTAGSDFTSSPTVVTFLPGETSAQVQVPITDDSILEDTENFSATLSTTDSNIVFGDDTAFVTILDNNGKCLGLYTC